MKKKFQDTILFNLILLIVRVMPTAAQSQIVDLSKGVIVCPKKLNEVETKTITVLAEEIKKRTGIDLPLMHKLPADSLAAILVCTERQVDKFDLKTDIEISSLKPEGYLVKVQTEPTVRIFLFGKDQRGMLYAVGKFLRNLKWGQNLLEVNENLNIISSPRYPIRGHQLGYRPKTNAYDAWSVEQFDLYIRELALFGANAIEIMPPRTDDDMTSSHMVMPPMEMMIKQAEIIDSYGLDVWMWYPNMGRDYRQPDSIKKELQERDEIFKKLKRLNVVFVPGGDPGDLGPDILFDWLENVGSTLQKYHPKAKIWVSPQAFRPVKEWLDSFYAHVNKKYAWFGGVVFGPWVKTPLPEMRKIVDKEIPIRRYPDITHSISCQYPVQDWDVALAMTLGRECYNPRPVAEKAIHNALDEYANGSISYSEGINDDVNKFVWSDLDWNPNTPVIETLRDYARLFISSDFADDIAQGILALERNWAGKLISNPNVEVTLQQWTTMEKVVSEEVKINYRFQMCLLLAYYNAYVKERLLFEKNLERQAREILRQAENIGSKAAMQQAADILCQAREKPVARHYYNRCWEIADYLYEKIGSQTSVQRHDAMPGRGDFMDYIDAPLNDAIWLLSQFNRIRVMETEDGRLDSITALLERTNPGPGGFYDNFGNLDSKSRLAHYPDWQDDPGSLKSVRFGFGVGLQGQEGVHTVAAKGFDGSATPLAWMAQFNTLYDTPLHVHYENLDTEASYNIRVAYTGRFRSKIRLVADGKYVIHDFITTGISPIHEFEIPSAATQDGVLELSWTCGEGQRGSQVAEVWLMKR